MATDKPKSANVGGKASAVRSDRGTTLAEFALVLPLLLVILFAIVEFGIAFNRAQAVEAAAREGGRLASLGSTTAGDVDARVNAALAGIPLDNPANITLSAPCANREGQTVIVTVSTLHNISVPLIPPWNVNLQSQAIFRCEAGN
jgi:Flp pilus assembly protein TadG